MKLPCELLRPLVETAYVQQEGDIEIASLQRKVLKTVDVTHVTAAEICDENYRLTSAGMRTLNVLKSMKDECRRRILAFTSAAEQHVTAIAEHLQMTQPAVSHHLALLFSEGHLRKKRDGKHNFYAVSEECRNAIQSLCRSFDRLKGAESVPEIAAERKNDAYASLVSLLSDPMRLQIIHILESEEEMSVNALCKHLNVSQPGVSHHLALMREGQLIAYRKDGKHNYYSIAEHGKSMILNAKKELLSMIGATPA